MYQVEVAVAKIGKYATSESGDTFEMVERPRGGLSFVLVDGQRSGRGAKFISNLVARKAISLLGEGVRDEAAAKAAHDYLYAHRGGQVSATLNIVSIIPHKRAIVSARNSPVPIVVLSGGTVTVLDAPSQPVGFHEHTEPVLDAFPIAQPMCIVVATDGVVSAGSRGGRKLDLPTEVESICQEFERDVVCLADALVARAVALDGGRPSDDISVLALAVTRVGSTDGVRRLVTRLPLGP